MSFSDNFPIHRQNLHARLDIHAIAERLGENLSSAWRRVVRYERILRERAEAASRTQRPRE